MVWSSHETIPSDDRFKEAKLASRLDDDGLGARGYTAEDTAAVSTLSQSESARWKDAVDFFSRFVLPDRMGVDSLVLEITTCWHV